MKLTLTRYELTPARTFGKLTAEDGHRLCYTLEDAVREVPGKPVGNWKVHGKQRFPQALTASRWRTPPALVWTP